MQECHLVPAAEQGVQSIDITGGREHIADYQRQARTPRSPRVIAQHDIEIGDAGYVEVLYEAQHGDAAAAAAYGTEGGAAAIVDSGENQTVVAGQ